jgi:hypothetical protein
MKSLLFSLSDADGDLDGVVERELGFSFFKNS